MVVVAAAVDVDVEECDFDDEASVVVVAEVASVVEDETSLEAALEALLAVEDSADDALLAPEEAADDILLAPEDAADDILLAAEEAALAAELSGPVGMGMMADMLCVVVVAPPVVGDGEVAGPTGLGAWFVTVVDVVVMLGPVWAGFD